MTLRLHCGPHRSGRTTALLAIAEREMRQGGLVWWIGLPTQRAEVYRRFTTQAGAAVGLEFLSFQQFAYRVLTAEQTVSPLLIGSARLVAVGSALLQTGGAPSPGEARLFLDGIAEAKRHGLTPQHIADFANNDPELSRLARTYAAYEDAIHGHWDYDDAREQLTERLERGPLHTLEPAVILVDGFREFTPAELHILTLIAEHVDVHVALREPPPGMTADYTYEQRPPRTVEEYLAANPVAEMRYVLSRVKADLIAGVSPLDMAIIVPDGRAAAVQVLASEFGIPVYDEEPLSLAESAAGRILSDVLHLPDNPTASNLLIIPELAPLAAELLDYNVAGADAIAEIAERIGMLDTWQHWFDLFNVDDASFTWANHVVREVLPTLTDELTPTWQNKALSAAQEAAKLGVGTAFREWWAALLENTFERVDTPQGVPILTTTRIANRQFAIAYVTGASQGAYSTHEREDYFVPEELRSTPGVVTAGTLPARYAGMDEVLFAELRTRAAQLTVTAPAADQSGGRPFEPALLHNPQPIPEFALGSTFVPASEPFHAPFEPVAFVTKPTVEFLRQYETCPFRAWATRRLGIRDEADVEEPWFAWRDALLAQDTLTERRISELSEEYPQLAPWLAEHGAALMEYRFGVSIPGSHASAHLSAVKRVNGNTAAQFVHFTGPHAAPNHSAARQVMQQRWNEVWAAAGALYRKTGAVDNVFITVWPLLGEPIELFPAGLQHQTARLQQVVRNVQRVMADYETGNVTPRPGFHCRTCPVFDTCREGIL